MGRDTTKFASPSELPEVDCRRAGSIYSLYDLGLCE